jgi:hypothetical protein
VKQLLKKIGIEDVGHQTTDGNYIIDLEDSDHFNRIFSKLDKSDLVEENEDSSVVNLDVTNIMYIADECAINLIADFSQDTYRLVATKLEDK